MPGVIVHVRKCYADSDNPRDSVHNFFVLCLDSAFGCMVVVLSEVHKQ